MEDYPYIRKWGRFMGSFVYYIEDQIRQAREDKAPEDAIYREDNGHWHRASEIKNEDTRRLIMGGQNEAQKN
jgi:hypothetical protein